MQIAVLIIGLIGFILSFAVVGIFPSAAGLLLGLGTYAAKKKKMKLLGRIETVAGIIFSILGILISVILYLGATKGMGIFGVWLDMIVDRLQFWKNWKLF